MGRRIESSSNLFAVNAEAALGSILHEGIMHKFINNLKLKKVTRRRHFRSNRSVGRVAPPTPYTKSATV